MTATEIPVALPNFRGVTVSRDDAERALHAERVLRANAEHEVMALRAGIGAMVDELVGRALIRRRNDGHLPPTEADLAEVAARTARYWLRVAAAGSA